MAKKSSFTTVYDPKQAGALAFSAHANLDTDIQSYLDVVRQLKVDFDEDASVVAGLAEVEHDLNALRISTEPEEALRKRLQKLVSVPIGNDSVKLDGFRKSAAKSTLANMEEYRERVTKLIRNTLGTLAQLMLTWPEDAILQRFLKELHELERETDARALKNRLDNLSGSPQLWHYNDRKKQFLAAWLRPYQELFEGAAEDLSPADVQKAVAKVAALRETKLEEMTNLELVDDRKAFRVHNRTMHPVMNGRNSDFWGTTAVRDEFISIMQQLLNRFSINLEDRFLLFRTQDREFCFLVGFSDDALDNMIALDGGKLGLVPHLKVFFKAEQGHYSEITEVVYEGDAPAYYKALRTAVVPFIMSIAVMLEVLLSPGIKEAFDMWT